MTESLKILRLLHQILMVVAGTVLAFALRADLSRESNAALRELAALRQLSFENYPAYLHARYFKEEEENDRTFLLQAIRRAGVRTIAEPSITLEPIFCDSRPKDTRLIGYEAFFSETHRIAAIRLGRDFDLIVEQLKAGTANNSNLRLTGAWFSGGETPLINGMRIMDWSNPPPNNVTSLQFIFNDLNGAGQAITIPIRVTYAVTPIKTGQFALAWLGTDEIGQRLLDQASGTVLPNLKGFWSRVAIMDIESATLFLQQQIESNKRGATLSFFGIPVDTELAVWAGPTTCFFVLFFFFLHFRRFKELSEPSFTLHEFPWIALFPDHLSGTVAYASLVILPIVSSARLVWRYGQINDGATKVGAIITFALLGIGIWVFRILYQFRKRTICRSTDSTSTQETNSDGA